MVRLLLLLTSLVLAFASTKSAWAGVIEPLSASSIRRSHVTHPAVNPLWISRADCEEGDVFTFSLNLKRDPRETFEMWVSEGVDCTSAAARGVAGVAPTCSRVFSSTSSTGPTLDFALTDAQIITALLHVGYDTASVFSCEPPFNAGSGPQPLSIFFMLVAEAGQSVSSMQTVAGVKFLLQGPEPPAPIVASANDSGVRVSWSQSVDTNIAGYYVLCDPPAGPIGSSEGTDSGCAPGVPCFCSPAFQAQEPDHELLAHYQCAQADGYGAATARATGLHNGAMYSVSIAAFDTVGNVGHLSPALCGTFTTPEKEKSDGTENETCTLVKGCSMSTPQAGATGGVPAGFLLVLCTGLTKIGRRSRPRLAARSNRTGPAS